MCIHLSFSIFPYRKSQTGSIPAIQFIFLTRRNTKLHLSTSLIRHLIFQFNTCCENFCSAILIFIPSHIHPIPYGYIWWFGCHFLYFPIYFPTIIPIDELIFFRGVNLAHQPGMFHGNGARSFPPHRQVDVESTRPVSTSGRRWAR